MARCHRVSRGRVNILNHVYSPSRVERYSTAVVYIHHFHNVFIGRTEMGDNLERDCAKNLQFFYIV